MAEDNARDVPFLRPVCPVDGCHQRFPDVHGCQVRGGGASRARRHCCESIKAPVTTSPTNTSGREMKSRLTHIVIISARGIPHITGNSPKAIAVHGGGGSCALEYSRVSETIVSKQLQTV